MKNYWMIYLTLTMTSSLLMLAAGQTVVTCMFNDSVLVEGTCFRYTNTTASYANAKTKCAAWGGALAKVTSGLQLNVSLAHAKANINVWIGANDIAVEGMWVWDYNNQSATELSTHNIWLPGEPTENSMGTWDCAAVYSASKHAWSEPCTSLYTYLCMEMPLTTTTTTHVPEVTTHLMDYTTVQGSTATTKPNTTTTPTTNTSSTTTTTPPTTTTKSPTTAITTHVPITAEPSTHVSINATTELTTHDPYIANTSEELTSQHTTLHVTEAETEPPITATGRVSTTAKAAAPRRQIAYLSSGSKVPFGALHFVWPVFISLLLLKM